MKSAEKYVRPFSAVCIAAFLALTFVSSGCDKLPPITKEGKISESKVVIASVNTAIKTYDATYGRLPSSGNTGRDTQIGANGNNPGNYLGNSTPSEYFKFCDVLTYTNHTGAGNAPSNDVSAMNPKGQQFIAPSESYFDRNSYGIRDSWGRSLLIALDTDGDGKCTFSTPWGSTEVRNGRCIVISLGDQTGKTIDPGKVIYSDKK